MQAPTAWRKAPTTTRVFALPRFLSKAQRLALSVAARRSPICLRRSCRQQAIDSPRDHLLKLPRLPVRPDKVFRGGFCNVFTYAGYVCLGGSGAVARDFGDLKLRPSQAENLRG